MRAILSNRSIATRLLNAATNKTACGQGGRIENDVAVPSISPDEILVKVKAVALNPTDFKHLDVVAPPNSIIGCDYAGEVHLVGENVTTKWQIGDRIAGVVHGGLFPDRGAFAEYLKTDADLAWKIPDDICDADAATYGISAVTALLSLNIRHGLPWANERASPIDEAIFIYAGSTSAGLYHIQLAKAAGYKVIATASPRSFDLVKSYGADAVFDYKSPTVVSDITKEFPAITKAVDCFSEGKSTEIAAEVIKNKGGKVVTLLSNGKPRHPGVVYELVMMYTAFGRRFQWLPPVGPKFEAKPDDREALARFYALLPQLTEILKPIPTTEIKGGFDGILEGLNMLRSGHVSGGKLIVKL
ncbi:chaperonin 10-like protein [Fusarium oxysporum Fo47]|uniref:Uncharacterized protein n=1 Tax=Fusarium oxysporum Fo47 TaxID=660027 RepID=W9JGQ7_FUSOX|nr:chaperonin 10-like protein [Fusarium oxysporum Fo47]EWZ28643.1 hypothetical protein FOZG_17648 [Fusarium oxysporum Fo47]QKD57151.1 chaperonin 10-like protein [Fusarium oxysporum Fo47]